MGPVGNRPTNGQTRAVPIRDGHAAAPARPVELDVPRPGLLQVVWHRRLTVLIGAVVCLAVALGYLVQATPIYTSTSRLYVEQKGPRIMSEAEGVMTESKNYLYTQGELLRSTPILASALEKANVAGMEALAEVDNQVGFLKKELSIGVGRKDDIISVSFDSPYPDEAARLVNGVVDAYVTYHTRKKRSTATEVLKILQKEKARRDTELAGKFQRMLDFQRDNGTLSFEADRGNIVLQRLAKLSEALTDAQLEAIEAGAAYETARAARSDPVRLKQLIDLQARRASGSAPNGEELRLHAELNRCQLALAELRRRFTASAPAVKAAEARLAELRRQVTDWSAAAADRDAKLAEAYLAVMSQRKGAAEDKRTEVQRSFDEQLKQVEQFNVKAARYAVLKADLDRTEKLCDILDTRIKELNITEDAGPLNITILEVAKPGDKPTRPHKAQTLAMALALGLILGVGASLLRDWMDQRLRSAAEISSMLGVPVLGVVPHIGQKKTPPHERGQRVRLDPHSNAAEAYRTIRTAVYFGVPDGRARTMLVTSPSPGDGKTTLASNLAIAIAQAGQRTLILDADFRRPMQHRIFQVGDEVGLANVLAGRGRLEEAIQPTGVDGLDILPCGPIPPNPSEMLNSRTFAALIEQLSRRYDHVLVDSPPVMPVADARILGAMCSVTLLVLRAEKSTRKAAEEARDGLLSVGAQILGTVVNDVSTRRGRYGYYGGYGYSGYGGYGYGRERSDGPPRRKSA